MIPLSGPWWLRQKCLEAEQFSSSDVEDGDNELKMDVPQVPMDWEAPQAVEHSDEHSSDGADEKSEVSDEHSDEHSDEKTDSSGEESGGWDEFTSKCVDAEDLEAWVPTFEEIELSKVVGNKLFDVDWKEILKTRKIKWPKATWGKMNGKYFPFPCETYVWFASLFAKYHVSKAVFEAFIYMWQSKLTPETMWTCPSSYNVMKRFLDSLPQPTVR